LVKKLAFKLFSFDRKIFILSLKLFWLFDSFLLSISEFPKLWLIVGSIVSLSSLTSELKSSAEKDVFSSIIIVSKIFFSIKSGLFGFSKYSLV